MFDITAKYGLIYTPLTINHFIMSADPIATTVTRAQTVESYCNGGN